MKPWHDTLHISTGSHEPIYLQLVEQVRRLVASGAWPPGQQMPSVRELAQALAVNPMTVSKAYGLLEAQGVLERRRGLAMVVAARPAAAEPQQDAADLLRPTLLRAAMEAHQLGLSRSRAMGLFKEAWQQLAADDTTTEDPS